MRKEPVSKAWGKVIIEQIHFLFVSFEVQVDLVSFIPSERLRSWFPQGGRLRQLENRHTMNNIYFKFVVDLLRRKGKLPGARNE